MSKRALAERRPWLLGSVVAALAYWLLAESDFPGLYLIALKGAPFAMLAIYALLRFPGSGARLVAGGMIFSGIGTMSMDFWLYPGLLAHVVGFALLIGLFLRNPRERLTATQKAAATALLLLVPAIFWFVPADRDLAWTLASYGIVIGGTGAAAWASAFPRYRVGTGAVLVVLSQLVAFAGEGPLSYGATGIRIAWPLFYAGMFLICTGMIQTLRQWSGRPHN
ncbi:hypothetical protein GCM10011371_05880 [Novosphingobium marinum]|uniref:Lysoplasmalogenase n=1 Tax=Novosphingobium marinum TaxID=1514948 RepID=A0A7Y9XWA2_9SPHN|nr:lysoplasmalogenase family protein [Novosphingobium marinum]NYH94276.1 hypothetical protein [Novosphingobium marinum]GGC21036.1 hypothetical protein GCM10011371_05880 [Novosphingobium marinum]